MSDPRLWVGGFADEGSDRARLSLGDLLPVSQLVLVVQRDQTFRPFVQRRPIHQWATPGKPFDEYVVEWQLSDAAQS
jgi:hypothetical protein